jgi:sepiapterin reductase
VARTEDDLAETASLMQEAAQQSSTALEVSCTVADLSDLDTLEETVEEIFEPLLSSPSPYDKAILINNAGSLGYLGQGRDMKSLSELQHAINFNITSSFWLSSQFAGIFAKTEGETGTGGRCIIVIVNISSLCAIEPFKTMSVYCAGKAARDIFHAAFAKEEETNLSRSGSRSCRILNYAPGMCETAMSLELAESDRLDKDLGTMYQTSLKEKTMVQPKDTADKLVRIVVADEWISGAHIDYWDE